MKITNQAYILIALLCFYSAVSLHGQTNSSEQAYYQQFDALVGVENLDLNNGVEYVFNKRIYEGRHQFYGEDAFTLGTVVYDGQFYPEVSLKYDLFSDQIIVVREGSGGASIIQLIKEKTEAFTINDLQFIRLDYEDGNKLKTSGFHEVLIETDHFKLLKRYQKNQEKRIANRVVVYEYRLRTNYVFLHNNSYTIIKNKKDLVKLFPQYKKELNLNNDRSLLKNQPDNYMKSLVNQLERLLTEENSQN